MWGAFFSTFFAPLSGLCGMENSCMMHLEKPWGSRSGMHKAGQIITTFPAEVTLNGGLIRELPQNTLNSGLGIILICPDAWKGLEKKVFLQGKISQQLWTQVI